MRQLENALSAWDDLDCYSNLASFKHAIFESDHELEAVIGLRSLCWKIFLLFKNLDRSSWPLFLYDSRSAYESLRAHYLRAIEHPDEVGSSVDPLSADAESPWTALRADEALRAEIYQDVERCMPESVYFRQPATQNMLLDILFVYCKLNPDVGYRQGMHELLAPVLWAVERDAVEPSNPADVKYGGEAGEGVLQTALDSRYIEHDTFTIFGLIMQTAKSFYDPGVETGPRKQATNARVRPTENESAMLIRSRRIFNDLLARVDPGLATHLEELEVSPQIFLMRWIRLLFGREFPFDDLLRVWDLLFAEDPSLELVDYICIAMLLRIRWQLTEADLNEALTLLLRYPCPSDPHGPHTLVQDAVYIKANIDVDGGISIVTKYSGRPPPRISRVIRPSTPNPSAGIRTPDSSRARSPFGSPSGSTVESMLSDAARGVISQGARWGLNQALRDAVGEVRKNVQGLNSGLGSPRTGAVSGIRPLHRTTRSDVSTNIAANVLRKITALEERNKQLAKMLEGAVADLWKFEKEASEKKEVKEQSLQDLSMAVAKVQFVQIFLQDSTLPLPPEEPPSAEKDISPETESAPVKDQDVPAGHAPHTQEPPAKPPTDTPPVQDSPALPPRPSTSTLTTIPIPTILRPPTTATPPPSLPTTSITADHASALNAANFTQLGRPKLEQSSFSWMLGQAHEDRSGFVNASPFSPHERRYNAAHGGTEKGFLFGEEEDEVVGEPPKVHKEKGKGKGKSKARSQSILKEDIGLGDLSGADP